MKKKQRLFVLVAMVCGLAFDGRAQFPNAAKAYETNTLQFLEDFKATDDWRALVKTNKQLSALPYIHRASRDGDGMTIDG